MGLKLPDHIIKIDERIIEKLIRQQVGIDEIAVRFHARVNLRCHFMRNGEILKKMKWRNNEEIFIKKEEFYFVFVYLYIWKKLLIELHRRVAG